MPPRKSARAAAAAAAATSAPSLPLKGITVVICGTFEKGVTLASVTSLVKKLGGETHASVIKAVTHVITTDYYFNANGAKIRPAIDNANVKIVNYDWLLQCEKEDAHVKENKYVFKGKPKGSASKSKSNSPVPAAVNGSASKTNGKKRAAELSDDEDDEEEEKPSTKRTKRATAKDDDCDSDDSKPASKAKGKAAATKAAAKTAPKAAAKAAPRKTAAAKGKGKAVAPPSEDEEEEDEDEDDEIQSKPEEKEDKKPTKTKKKEKALVIPLDDYCTLAGYKVLISDAGLPYDASLNQSNASNNNNKFYRVQLLVNNSDSYRVWTRWGRVGERGLNATLGNGSLADGIKNFEKKFRDKSGLSWENRLGQGKAGKYTFIERSYDDSDDEGDNANDDGDVNEEDDNDGWTPPESKLEPEVQDLIAMIFNTKFMQAAFEDLNYDAKKLPLGKLSKNTITKGFQTLKDLAALFDDQALAQNTYGVPYGTAVENLSNQFYSLIPHAFGRNRPPIIGSEPMLKKEVELMESLGDMKEAAAIMKAERAQKRPTEHEYDRQYNALGMEEMTALDRDSDEFKNIEKYLLGTKGATHSMDFEVESIFRVERQGEVDRFKKSEYADMPSDRRLLWHGSRATNFGGILSQGLRIAPKEAPVSGYMFGKGIYLADMASKSANYCCSHLSGNTGLLLLCESELGDPMYTLTNASYNAGDEAQAKGMYSTWGQGKTGPSKWKDASCINPNLKGVKIPDTDVKPGDTNVPGAYLQYNEYITYSTSSTVLRYLLKVRMKYSYY